MDQKTCWSKGRVVLMAAAAATIVFGCAPATTSPVLVAAAGTSVVVATVPECVRIQRGETSGTVADGRISERQPDKNYGDYANGMVGDYDRRRVLLDFDLSGIPRDATVTHASLTLNKTTPGGSTLTVHQVTEAWREDRVTWNDFGGYDGDEEARLETGELAAGRISLEVTSMVRRWVAGESPNQGMVLRQSGASATITTSEADAIEDRPRLDVCFTRTRMRTFSPTVARDVDVQREAPIVRDPGLVAATPDPEP